MSSFTEEQPQKQMIGDYWKGLEMSIDAKIDKVYCASYNKFCICFGLIFLFLFLLMIYQVRCKANGNASHLDR